MVRQTKSQFLQLNLYSSEDLSSVFLLGFLCNLVASKPNDLTFPTGYKNNTKLCADAFFQCRDVGNDSNQYAMLQAR